jgi:hypothetical protein
MTLEEYACKVFNCTVDEMRSRTRIREAVSARQVCMAVMRNYTILSYAMIGSHFNLDHSTAIHSIKTVKNLYATDRIFRSQVDRIYDACRSGEIDVPFSNLIRPPGYVPCNELDEEMKLYAELV